MVDTHEVDLTELEFNQVSELVNNAGLKDGYSLIMLIKL